MTAANDDLLKDLPELKDLPALAAWRDRRKQSGKEKRPFIVEIAGMPKAGKSSAIAQIRHFFSHGLKVLELPEPGPFKVYTPAEGVSLRTPALLRDNLLEYNTWAGAYALQQLLWANHDDFYDLVILDRGPWDAGCWLEYVRNRRSGDFEVPECTEKIIEFFQLAEWTVKADLHVVLIVDPDEAHERERHQRLIPHGGPASNKNLMERMRAIYSERFRELQAKKAEHCPDLTDTCLLLDTTNTSDLDVAREIIRSILGVARATKRTPVSTTDSPSLETTESKPVGRAPSLVTERSIRNVIRPFTVNMKPTQKRELKNVLGNIVECAATLSPEEQQLFLENLQELVPNEQALLNSVSSEVLSKQMNDILKRSKKK